jgi:pimeloyl-ACP methyl ester carboxylesterase
MGPAQLPGALQGMPWSRRFTLELGSRYPNLTKRSFLKMTARYRENPRRFLDRLVTTWSVPDQKIFRERKEIYELFLCDLQQVFVEGNAPESLSQELRLFRNYGFTLDALPADRSVILWQGLDDNIVPPVMAWKMARTLPNCEVHLVPGGHFMAVDAADQMMARLRQSLDASAGGVNSDGNAAGTLKKTE